jgi:hypothetical protein
MALRRSRFDRLGGSVALQGVKCLLAVIQASWVSHGASPHIKMQEHNPAFCHRAWEVTRSARRIISVVARRETVSSSYLFSLMDC